MVFTILLNNIIAIIAISFTIVGAMWGIGNLLNPPSEKNIEKSHDSILLVAQNNDLTKQTPHIFVKENKPTELIILNKDLVNMILFPKDWE